MIQEDFFDLMDENNHRGIWLRRSLQDFLDSQKTEAVLLDDVDRPSEPQTTPDNLRKQAMDGEM